MAEERALVPKGEMLPSATPKEVVEQATEQANLLNEIVRAKNLYKKIQGKDYLVVEGWQTIGAFNATTAHTDWVRPIEREDKIVGYEAQVSLWKRGELVASAIMSCGLDEFPCQGKEGEAKHKACRSAAQTWAESKAYRMNFAWVAVLAGFEPTPAEEVIDAPPGKAQSQGPAMGGKEEWRMWLEVCPDHGVVWFKGRYGRAHKWEENEKGWCNLKDIFKGWVLTRQEQLGWGNDQMKEWLKEHYGGTWSKLTEEQQAEAIHKLGLEIALKNLPDDATPE